MAINIQRQQAFSAAFNQYPDILEQFAKNNVNLVDMQGNPFPKRENHTLLIMELLMAQFITRLIQTRATNSESPLMKEFAEFTVQRYKNMTTKNIGMLQMYADDKYRGALNHIENGMATVILNALVQEAEIDEVAEENGNANREFDEADFWHDVMLGLGAYYRKSRHPKWWHVTQEMFINHKAEFKKALDDENRLVLEAEALPNPKSQKPANDTRH